MAEPKIQTGADRYRNGRYLLRDANRRKVQNLLLDNDAFDLVADVLHLPESECLFWDRRKLVAFDTNLGSRFRRISRQFPRGWP